MLAGHGQRHTEEGSMVAEERGRPSTRVIVAIIVAVVLLIFIVQNNGKGRIDFLFWNVQTRVWVALAIAALLGFVAGYLIGKVSWGKD
jgi:uncharacterized integral membrane protein